MMSKPLHQEAVQRGERASLADGPVPLDAGGPVHLGAVVVPRQPGEPEHLERQRHRPRRGPRQRGALDGRQRRGHLAQELARREEEPDRPESLKT